MRECMCVRQCVMCVELHGGGVHVWCTVYGMCVCIGGEVGGSWRSPGSRKLNSCIGGDNPGREHVKNHLKDL